MAARKTAKKAQNKRASAKKPVKPVRPVASSKQSELDELKTMRMELNKGFDELNKGLKELNKARDNFRTEQNLAKLNRELAAGKPIPLVKEAPTPEEAPDKRIERQREEARAERKRKRLEERQQAAQAVAPTPAPMPAPVADLSEARAKKASANQEKDQGPIKLPMSELCKYKLEVLNRNYNDSLEKVRAAVRPKYEQLMAAEVRQLASRDAACISAQKEQIEYINEIVQQTDSDLPEGYAITQLLTEVSVIVAQYVPDRAGKPLPLPGLAPPEEG